MKIQKRPNSDVVEIEIQPFEDFLLLESEVVELYNALGEYLAKQKECEYEVGDKVNPTHPLLKDKEYRVVRIHNGIVFAMCQHTTMLFKPWELRKVNDV